MNSDQEREMTQYLLGQFPEHEEAEMERRYLADDTLFEELLTIEDDLRDAYAREELSPLDREAFERRLLALPRQRKRQDFARTLHRYILERERPAHSTAHRIIKWEWLLSVVRAKPVTVLAPALTAALAILIVGGWWLGHRMAPPPTTGPVPGHAPVAQAPALPGVHEPQKGTLVVTLTPGLVRGSEEARRVVIPPDVSRVRLEAGFEGDYPRYHAMLATVEGREVWSEGNLQPQTFPGGTRILLDLSSGLLAPGDYILTVRGLTAAGPAETVAEYAFRVEKK